jgi:hypothetical protein
MRQLAILSGAIMLAGCGAAPARPAAKPAGQSSSPVSPSQVARLSGSPSATRAARQGCPGPTPVSVPAGFMTGVQFVSATRGWVVGQDKILATSDGGQHWRVQDSGTLDLTSLDFIGNGAGWAVGTKKLLATTDGGAHWTSLPDPCPLIRSVHFVSRSVGFAVAGGRNVSPLGPATPEVGGVVLTTADGGHSWRTLPTPRNAQTVCFDNAETGWLGAGGGLYRSTDGGRHWAQATAGVKPLSPGYPATMIVQCAGAGSAWAMDVGPGGEMSQQPHVGYHADAAGAGAIFAEQYFPHPGVRVHANSPGSNARTMSAISPTTAAFIDACVACGLGTAPWALASRSGAVLTREGNVGKLNLPEAASFLSAELGWVVGVVIHDLGGGRYRQYQRIVRTADGGRTWQVQYTSS